MSVGLKGVFCAGLYVSGDNVEGEVYVVDLVLLGAFSFLGVDGGVLLFRLLLYLLVTPSPMVGWVVGRGCFGMRVSGFGV